LSAVPICDAEPFCEDAARVLEHRVADAYFRGHGPQTPFLD
jgi:hypothetical protein